MNHLLKEDLEKCFEKHGFMLNHIYHSTIDHNRISGTISIEYAKIKLPKPQEDNLLYSSSINNYKFS